MSLTHLRAGRVRRIATVSTVSFCAAAAAWILTAVGALSFACRQPA